MRTLPITHPQLHALLGASGSPDSETFLLIAREGAWLVDTRQGLLTATKDQGAILSIEATLFSGQGRFLAALGLDAGLVSLGRTEIEHAGDLWLAGWGRNSFSLAEARLPAGPSAPPSVEVTK